MSAKFSNSLKGSSWKVYTAFGLLSLTLASLHCAPASPTGVGGENKLQSSLSRPNSNNAQHIVEQILVAYGGEPKFRQIYEEGCHGFGKYIQISSLSGAVNSFDVEIFNKGDKIREEMKVFGEQMVGGYDGKHSWLKQANEVIQDNIAGHEQTREEIEHGLQLLLKLSDKNTQVRLKPASPAEKNLYNILEVTTGDGASTTVYVDKKTHLINRTEFMGLDDEQGLPVTKAFLYEDYRPFVGTMIPYKVSEFSGNKKASETILSSIKQESLSDSLFQVPKAGPSLIAKNESVTIPFQLASGEIVIYVSVNGKANLPFVIDTGATQCLVDTDEAALLGKTEQSDLSITTGSGSVPMSYMKVRSLTLGKIICKDLPVVVTDLSSLKIIPGKKIAGMLGANILRQFIVTFDFPNKTVTFSHPDNYFETKSATVLTAKPSLGGAGLMVAGELDGKKLDFLIDTGAAYSLIPHELASQIMDKSIPSESILHGLDGQPVKVASRQFSTLRLGDTSIERPVFFVASEKAKSMGMIANGSVAILGNPIWKNYCLTLDYKKQKIILRTGKCH